MNTPHETPDFLPRNPDTAGHWDALDAGLLALCWCPQCETYQQPPVEACRQCAQRTTFRPVSGRGTLHSYIVVHRAIAPGYRDNPGHVIGLVDLDDQHGLRLATQLIDVEPNACKIGMPVEGVIADVTDGRPRLPTFRAIPPPTTAS